MTPQEIQIVEKSAQHLSKLNDWERGFIGKLYNELADKRRWPLSEKQATALHAIDEKLFEMGVSPAVCLFTTSSGRLIDFQAVSSSDIDIWDIAHGLSLACRFNGQCSRFYSVAAHSMRVAELAPEGEKLQALLHDAPEAYIGDINTPAKKLLPCYRKLESTLWRAVCNRYRIPEDISAAVKAADQQAFEEEAATIHSIDGIKRSPVELNYASLDELVNQFMGAFYKYGGRE